VTTAGEPRLSTRTPLTTASPRRSVCAPAALFHQCSDGDDVAKTGTLTFAPGETTKTITIAVKGDNKKEAKETFYLDLYDNSGNALFTRNRGIGTILNDD
jgi:hypothetical protein